MSAVVQHKAFGEGTVLKIENGIIEIQFGEQIKKFQFPKAFEQFIKTDDIALIAEINKEKEKLKQIEEAEQAQKAQAVTPAPRHVSTPTHIKTPIWHSVSNALVGERAHTIFVHSEEEMFEIVGYMATPGRVSSIEAEVPRDGRDEIFEEMFPGQTYRPITMGNTPSGMPNKLSSQFRINFANLKNCPDSLRRNMGKGNGGCVGRINKSKFVIDIVQNYGFRFGDWQDVNAIREIAVRKGHLESFENGFKR